MRELTPLKLADIWDVVGPVGIAVGAEDKLDILDVLGPLGVAVCAEDTGLQNKLSKFLKNFLKNKLCMIW